MARIGGRNTATAWVVGLICAGVVAALGVIALPLVPSVIDFGSTLVQAVLTPGM